MVKTVLHTGVQNVQNEKNGFLCVLLTLGLVPRLRDVSVREMGLMVLHTGVQIVQNEVARDCGSGKREKWKARKVVKTECRQGVQNVQNEKKRISLCLANSRVSPATAGCLRARNGFNGSAHGCPK